MTRLPVGPPPPDLAGPASKGGKERLNAAAFFKERANREKTFQFAAYKERSIVDALNAHFGFKCAYCESSYGATQPVDVEHYRPKGGIEVDGKLRKPGYYWLAAEWTNLLPSCIDCNRKRTHDFPEADPELRGKANRFPIANPTQRANKAGEERRERRLLLHPYLDEPSKHLKFGEEGSVRPALDTRGRPSRMGEASIEVYGLDRPELAKLRNDRLVDLQGLMERIRIAIKLKDGAGGADATRLFDLEVEALKYKLGPGQTYLEMARQLVEDFLKSIAK